MCTRTGRPPELCVSRPVREGEISIIRTCSFGGVGLRHITYETTEQRSEGFRKAAEGRAPTKENDVQHHTYPTQSGIRVSQGLGGVRRTAQARKQEQFTALLHHLTVDLLRESYYALKRGAAPGVDE